MAEGTTSLRAPITCRQFEGSITILQIQVEWLATQVAAGPLAWAC